MSEEKIKYELGTVVGIYSKILFSQYPGAGTGTITLSDTVDNYKHIIVCAQYSIHDQHFAIKTMMVDINMLRNSDTDIARILMLSHGNGTLTANISFTVSGNVINIVSSDTYLITEVVGIG